MRHEPKFRFLRPCRGLSNELLSKKILSLFHEFERQSRSLGLTVEAIKSHDLIRDPERANVAVERYRLGYTPEPMVRGDIEDGRLVRLDMCEYKYGFMRLHAIYQTDTPRARRPLRLIARFEAQPAATAEAVTQSSYPVHDTRPAERSVTYARHG